jgi:hypothetical protein
VGFLCSGISSLAFGGNADEIKNKLPGFSEWRALNESLEIGSVHCFQMVNRNVVSD